MHTSPSVGLRTFIKQEKIPLLERPDHSGAMLWLCVLFLFVSGMGASEAVYYVSGNTTNTFCQVNSAQDPCTLEAAALTVGAIKIVLTTSFNLTLGLH